MSRTLLLNLGLIIFALVLWRFTGVVFLPFVIPFGLFFNWKNRK